MEALKKILTEKDVLRVHYLEGLEKYLNDDALRVYRQKGEDIARARYLQKVVEYSNEEQRDKEIENAKHWIGLRLNNLSTKFEGVLAQLATLPLVSINGTSQCIVFIWLILKPEFAHLTKDDLNKI